MEKYEVIIVGAGYAGLAAACQLKGRETLVLERYDSVLEKRRASLGLMFPWGEKPRFSGRDLFFPELDLLVEEGLRAKYRWLELEAGSEQLTIPIDLALVDEGRLKGALLKKCLAAGVKIEMGNPVRHLIVENQRVRVLAEKDYQSRVVVGADGALGQSAQFMGVERHYRKLLYAREVLLSRLDLAGDRLLLCLGDEGVSLVALFDNERYRVLALQVADVREQPIQMQRKLDNFLRQRGGERVLESWTSIIRLYHPQEVACRSEFVLTGDAAAPWGFAGIGGALASGTLAGQIASRLLAASKFAPGDYRRTWHRLAGPLANVWLGRAALWFFARQKNPKILLRFLRYFTRWVTPTEQREGNNLQGS